MHQGGRLDEESVLYHFRNRDYSPTLGRWVPMDPIGFVAVDVNLYRTVKNRLTTLNEPMGLQGPGMYPSWYLEHLRKQEEIVNKQNEITESQIKSIIKGMNNICDDQKQRVTDAILKLVRAARFDWPHSTGAFGKCYNWVDKYNELTRGIRAEMRRNCMLGVLFEVDQVTWDLNHWLGRQLEAGHTAIRIAFLDGTVIYLDDKNKGGSNHVFTANKLPQYYKQTAGNAIWSPDPSCKSNAICAVCGVAAYHAERKK